jgi:hypothetical protein
MLCTLEAIPAMTLSGNIIQYLIRNHAYWVHSSFQALILIGKLWSPRVDICTTHLIGHHFLAENVSRQTIERFQCPANRRYDSPINSSCTLNNISPSASPWFGEAFQYSLQAYPNLRSNFFMTGCRPKSLYKQVQSFTLSLELVDVRVLVFFLMTPRSSGPH